MWYLFLQMWLWLLAAFLMGWFTHWIYSRESADKSPTEPSAHDRSTEY